MLGIREDGTQGDGSRAGVHDAAHRIYPTLLAVFLAVAQEERDVGHPADEGFDAAVLHGKVSHFALAQAEINPHLAVVADRNQRLRDAGTYEGSDVIGYHAGHATEGALHDRIAETVAGIGHLSLSLSHLCLSRKECLLGGL